jgi:hypothetical protein
MKQNARRGQDRAGGMSRADLTTTGSGVNPVSALARSAKMRYERCPMSERRIPWTV